MASAAVLPAQASVRGVRPASRRAATRGLRIDLGEQRFHRARRRRAQRFVEKDGLRQFLAH
jgi:hypothetical protein